MEFNKTAKSIVFIAGTTAVTLGAITLISKLATNYPLSTSTPNYPTSNWRNSLTQEQKKTTDEYFFLKSMGVI